MTWILIFIVIITLVYFGFINQKLQNRGSNKKDVEELRNKVIQTNESNPNKMNFEVHPDIKEFTELLVNTDKKILVQLQNEYLQYVLDSEIYKRNKQNQKLASRLVKEFEKEFGINSSTTFALFDTNHIDGEGPSLLTDSSGKIFRYHFAEPSLKLISNSIWDLFENKTDFISRLNSDQKQISFDLQKMLKDYIDIDRIDKFAIHGFYINDYKTQLEKLLEGTKDNLILNSFTWKEFEWHETEEIECNVTIKGLSKEITIEKSKWYDFKFPGKINRILADLDSQKRISLVHENSWDETHGILLSEKREYETLKRNLLIIE